MKRKEIVKMIDEVMKEVDVLMYEERDYDAAACKLSEAMWTIKDNLIKNKKESGNNGNE